MIDDLESGCFINRLSAILYPKFAVDMAIVPFPKSNNSILALGRKGCICQAGAMQLNWEDVARRLPLRDNPPIR